MERCVMPEPEVRSWTAAPLTATLEKQRSWPNVECKPPLDIREWIGPWLLASWIEEEADRLGRIEANVADFLRQSSDNAPGRVLRLLTFAYASRVFESDEIIQKCFSDAAFRGMCDGEPPSAQELRCFRRNHRVLLERSLSRILLRAVRQRFGLDFAIPQPELEADMLDRATERLNIARHMDQP
jgi:hypothetical protein